MTWDTFMHGAQKAGPILAGFLILMIPSVINALLPYKRTDGARKVLSVLWELLTFLAKNDSPMTIKLPGTVSPPPGAAPRVLLGRVPFKHYEEDELLPLPLPPPPPPLAALLLVSLALALSACGPRFAAGGKVLGQCELGQLPATLERVIADATAILFGGQAWQEGLEQLGLQLGPGQLDCVVKAVEGGLRARMLHGQTAPEYAEAIKRSEAWLGRGRQ